MKTVYLHGKLGKRFGKKWELAADSVVELFSAIECNSEGFLSYLVSAEKRGVNYCIFKKDPCRIKSKKELSSSLVTKDQVEMKGSNKEIHVIPSPQGGDPFSILALWTTVAGVTKLTVLGKIVAAVAISFIVGAIMKSLFKPPKKGKPTTTKSYLLQGSQNRTAQGVAVPIGYGTLKIGSTNISQDRMSQRLARSSSSSASALESFSSIEYLELLSEGPIGGIVSQDGTVLRNTDPREGIYLNNVPIKNPDPNGEQNGSLNFILNEEGKIPEVQLGNEGSGQIISNESMMTSEYGTKLYGAGPYQNNSGKRAHRTSFEEAVNNDAKMVSHFVANSEVTRVRLTFGAVMQVQLDNGGNSEEQVGFAIKILKDNKEYNVLDFASGCQVSQNPNGVLTTIVESAPLKGRLTQQAKNFFITGIATSTYDFDIVIDFPAPVIKSKGVTFKIVKVTNELDPSARGGNLGGLGKNRDLHFVSATDYVREKLLYPHSSICKLRFDSKNFSSIPQRSYLARLKKVLIPSNYNPSSRKYDGPWDGLFKGQADSSESIHSVPDSFLEWTDNPAWVYYDMLNNPRFGAAKYGLKEENIDKWQLYRIAKYCDQLVETSYPVETSSGLPRAFFTENKDDDESFEIRIEKDQLTEDPNDSIHRSRADYAMSESQFEEEFGSGASFKGKKVAFYISTSGSTANTRQENSCRRSGEIIIEERTIISSDAKNRTIKVQGPAFSPRSSQDINYNLSTGGSTYGACCSQINHPVVEPRFTANLYVTDRMEALGMINQIASIFRGITTYYNGKIVAVQDSQKSPVALFNTSNVSIDGFSYAGISKDQKITTSLVRFNNKDNNFKQDLVVEEDPGAIQRFGYKEEETLGFGITSESQARRLAKWMLFTTQLEIETVSFKAGAEASYLFPGAIFEVSDETRAGSTKSGRVLDIQTHETFYSQENDVDSEKVSILSPHILLDKSMMSEPFRNQPEIAVCVGVASSSDEKISQRAPFERSEKDQDAEIESIFTPQILRFNCAIDHSGISSKKGPQGQFVKATNLELKLPFGVDVGKNLFKIFNQPFEDGEVIKFLSEGALPTGLEHDKFYYVFESTKHTFKIKDKDLSDPSALEVQIQDEGFDKLGNSVNIAFVLCSKIRTAEALDKVSIGSSWSLVGRVAGKGDKVFSNDPNVKSFLELSDSLYAKGWFKSDFLGWIWISANDWVFSAAFGWMFIGESTSLRTWIWFEKMQEWVFIAPKRVNDQKRHWWNIGAEWVYVFYEGDDPIKIFIYNSNPVGVGQPVYIGSWAAPAISSHNSGDLGNHIALKSQEKSSVATPPAAKTGLEESMFDMIKNSEDYVEIDIVPDGIRAVGIGGDREESLQGGPAVRITLTSIRSKSVRIPDNFSAYIDASSVPTHFGLNSKEQTYKLIKVSDTECEIANSSAVATNLGTSFFGGGAVSFIRSSFNDVDSQLDSQLFRTMSVKEIDGNLYEVSGLEYVPAKFGAVDKRTKVVRPRLPIPPQASMDIPDAPTDLILTDLTL